MYLVFYKDDIIGIFNDKSTLNQHLDYCKKLNLMSNSDIKITTFRLNSLFGIENELPIKNNNIESIKKIEPIKNNKVEPIKKIEETPEVLAEKEKIAKEKADILHKINMLKHQKKLLEEEKTIYESDIKLYNTFKTELETNKEFEIPELFIEKYNIFKILEETNNLTFDKFKIEWDKVKPKNNYSMFSANPYEQQFETPKANIETETFVI
jgi:hypothetical protein